MDFDNAPGGGPVSCTVTFKNDGNITGHISDVANTDAGDWISPKDSFSNYEIKAHQESGNTISGSALDTWLGLGSNLSWTITDGVFGGASANAVISFQIRRTLAIDPTGVILWQSAPTHYTLFAQYL